MATTPLLELRNVTKKFGGSLLEPDKGVIALDDISLTIETDTPTLLTVAGESGSGKSTMGYTLLGFHEPTEGEVLYNGKNLQNLSRGEKWQFRQDVQAIFQDPFAVYNPFYKVDHLLRVPLRRFKLATSRKEVQMKIEEALESVGLRPQETLGRFPHQLSGGQRQRLVVARALLMRPKLIVADEPVSMVDASLRATILEALRTIKDEFGISIFYVTHDLTTAYHISDNILILYQGSIREAGDVDLVIKDPKDPYTQLLIRSIPWPDISRRWGEGSELVMRAGETRGSVTGGCKFADRCPHVMDICRRERPPLFRLDDKRAASCFLYDDQPTLSREQVNELFSVNGAVSHAAD